VPTDRAPEPFLDVTAAARLGGALARRHALPTSYRPGALQAQLTELSVVAQARVAAEAGLTPPGAPTARVLDRGDWVAANVRSVDRLLAPAMARAKEGKRLRPPKAVERFSRQSSAVQLGAVLAWMSTKVLGQYDILVGETPGVDEDVISYVGPNIVALEQRHGFDPEQFRLWLALHETAHRAQFTGAPWVRPYFLGLVDEVVSTVNADPAAVLGGLLRSARELTQGINPLAEVGAVGLIASDAQLEALRRLSALMSVLEGHGEVVMDVAAQDLVPDARHFHEVLRHRRASPGAAQKVLGSVLGLDAKLRQYEDGERFVRALRDTGGAPMVRRLFDGPSSLPTMAEVADPTAWLTRMVPVGR
jgi:coenzyme F420 biosynthesis associated uncharacterized protein